MALNALRSLLCIPRPTEPTFEVTNCRCIDTSDKKESLHDETIDDNPPPYSPPSTQDFNERTSPSLPSILQDVSGKTSTPTIRICPHDTLTLSRFDRILALPSFTTNGTYIDALTPNAPQHRRGDDSSIHTHRREHGTTPLAFPQDCCRPLSVALNDDYVSNLKGFGTYTYRSYCQQPGLLLSFHWELTPLPAWELQCRSRYSTASELSKFLKETGIRLCEHTNIWDMDIVEAVHPLLHAAATPKDPIERYLAKEGGLDCKECGAIIKVYLRTKGSGGRTCRIDARRWIGKEGERLVVRGGDLVSAM